MPHPVDTLLADEIEAMELADPMAFYNEKLGTVRWMQRHGTPDGMIEALLGIRLRDCDRNPEQTRQES